MYLIYYNPSICFTRIIDWKSNKIVLFKEDQQYFFVRIYENLLTLIKMTSG